METRLLVPCVLLLLAALVQGTYKIRYRKPSVNISVSPRCAFRGDVINIKCSAKNFYHAKLFYFHDGRPLSRKYKKSYSRPHIRAKYNKRIGTHTWQCKAYTGLYKVFSPKRKVHILEKPIYQPNCTHAEKYIVLSTTTTWQGAKNLCACLGYQLWVPASPAELQCVCEDILKNPKLSRDFFWLGGKKNGDKLEVGKGQKLVSIFPVTPKDKDGKCLSMSFDKFYVSDCKKKYKFICEKGRK